MHFTTTLDLYISLPTLTMSAALACSQSGLFATLNQYEAWVRLSHSVLNECCASDHASAHMGFSMKVLDTPGKQVSAPRVDSLNLDQVSLSESTHCGSEHVTVTGSQCISLCGSEL